MMGMTPYTIKREFEAMLLPPSYRLEQIDRFQFQFWNVKEAAGWDHKCNETLKKLILSDADLTESFKHLLEGALSNKNRRDIALHYRLMLSPEDRTREFLRAGDAAILAQNKQIENNDLKAADLLASIVSKTVNSGLKLGITPPTASQKKNPNLLDK